MILSKGIGRFLGVYDKFLGALGRIDKGFKMFHRISGGAFRRLAKSFRGIAEV